MSECVCVVDIENVYRWPDNKSFSIKVIIKHCTVDLKLYKPLT